MTNFPKMILTFSMFYSVFRIVSKFKNIMKMKTLYNIIEVARTLLFVSDIFFFKTFANILMTQNTYKWCKTTTLYNKICAHITFRINLTDLQQKKVFFPLF